MKILILQDFLRSGGTERQSVLLANAFAAAGHVVRLVTFRPGGALAATVGAAVVHQVLQPTDLGLDWFAPGLRRTVRTFAPEIILCMGRMANCYGGRLQRKFPAVTVLASMRTGKPLPVLFRRSLLQVRHIVANSRDARDTLVRGHDVPAERISVIHNSLVFPAETTVDPQTSTVRASLRAEHGATAATTVLLCVAMFRPEKNQRELVEIVAGLNPRANWQLWLAGTGPAVADCEKLALAQGLGSRIRFLGFHRNPAPFYLAADVAVHASWSEALSNFLIEAQAHGLPAIAYQAQGIEECFIPNQTGWAIPRDDRTAFRTALEQQFASSTATRTATSAAARAFARTTFDPARQVTAYLDLFQRLHPPAS